MNKFLSIKIQMAFLWVFTFMQLPVFAQCNFESYEFTSQATIDDFITNEPDCKEVLGYIRLIGPDIISLEGLSQIELIGGQLTISGTSLSTLAGLENLKSIENGVLVFNDELLHLDHFSSLDTISDDFKVQYNPQLNNIDGMSQVNELGGLLIITNNSIENVVGFDNITSMQGIDIKNEERLVQISGFNNLKNIWRQFLVDNCGSLSAIKGFDKLDKVGIDLLIQACTSTLRIEAFSELDSIGGNLVFNEMNLSNSGTMFQGLRSIGGNFILTNSYLHGHTLGFEKLFSVFGHLEISKNASPFDIGLNGLRFVDDIISIHDNIGLSKVSGFNNLLSQISELIIMNNSNLKEISGFNVMRKSFNKISIVENQKLENISGFSTLIELNDLELYENNSLILVDGFSNLEMINSDLKIEDCDQLTNLDGFQNVTFVDDWIKIINCNALSDISGLSNVDHTRLRSLDIEFNLSLSHCHNKFVCDAIDGNVRTEIKGNDTGCNNENQILANCELTNTEETNNSGLNIYPNPVGDILSLEGFPSGTYYVYTIDGSEKLNGRFENEEIDVSSLSQGVYILSFQNEDSVFNHRFVKSN